LIRQELVDAARLLISEMLPELGLPIHGVPFVQVNALHVEPPGRGPIPSHARRAQGSAHSCADAHVVELVDGPADEVERGIG
jgi:hypothetical protein